MDLPTGHGIADEPFNRPGAGRGRRDEGEGAAESVLRREAQRGGHADLEALHSAHEEPHTLLDGRHGPKPIERALACAKCGHERRGTAHSEPCRACGHRPARGYGEWYLRGRAQMDGATSWLIMLALAAVSGPLAFLGTFVGTLGEVLSLVFVPVVEELSKVLALSILIETRPYWIRSAAQIRIVALASALSFAIVENLLYVFVYLDDPTATLILWRWTVCTALHLVATALAAQGLVGAWRRVECEGRRPDLGHGSRWLVAAILLHAGYNAAMTVFELSGFTF